MSTNNFTHILLKNISGLYEPQLSVFSHTNTKHILSPKYITRSNKYHKQINIHMHMPLHSFHYSMTDQAWYMSGISIVYSGRRRILMVGGPNLVFLVLWYFLFRRIRELIIKDRDMCKVIVDRCNV